MKKWIVYYKNDYTLLKKEFFKFGETKVIGYHDPSRATAFSTKKEAEEKSKLIKFKTAVTELDPQVKKFERTTFKYREMPILNPKFTTPYDAKTMTRLDVLGWWKKIQRANELEYSSEVYGTYPQIWSLFDYLWDKASYWSKGYKELYHSFQVRTKKDGDYDKFKEELDLVLDDVTYMDGDYKVLPIFDHELSSWETRSLLYKSEDDCKIISGRFGDEKIKGTLKECFDMMRYQFYYE
jgi:hypothetical protein